MHLLPRIDTFSHIDRNYGLYMSYTTLIFVKYKWVSMIYTESNGIRIFMDSNSLESESEKFESFWIRYFLDSNHWTIEPAFRLGERIRRDSNPEIFGFDKM